MVSSNEVNTLILITLGVITGLLVSKSQYQKSWDMIVGALGALATDLIIRITGTGYNPYAFLMVMLGAVTIIHIGRFLQIFPQN